MIKTRTSGPSSRGDTTTSRFGNLAAIVVGIVLIIAGLGMGVSLVLLPVGVPVGILGLLLLLAGLSAPVKD